MASITGATTVISLSITGIFSSPQQLQGFAADDVFGTNPIDSAEFYMGVDGKMSGGFVYVPIGQNYHLQADSPSNVLFDTWWTTMVAQRNVFFAQGVAIFTAIGTKWNMTNGLLTSYTPTPTVKKLLQPRTHGITWESISPAAS